jgi:WD40 repeat protein
MRELCHENVIDSSVPLYQPCEKMEFSSDGRLLASAGHERLDLWDAVTGRNIHTYKDYDGWLTNHVSKVIFSPDSR